MTFQSQTPSYSGPTENSSDKTIKPMPLDRSSAEWRSQFGVLPSPWQQYATTRPVPGKGQRIMPPSGEVEARGNQNPLSILVGIAGVILVGVLIAYGYLPSQQAEGQKKAGENASQGIATASAYVKRPRDKAAAVHSPAVTATTAPRATSAPAAPGKQSVKVTKSAAGQRRAPRETPAPRTAVARMAGDPKRVVAAPRSRREALKTPTRRMQAAAVIAVAATPRPEAKPFATKAVVKSTPKPVVEQQLPATPRPNPESSDPGGTNPLGLPQ